MVVTDGIKHSYVSLDHLTKVVWEYYFQIIKYHSLASTWMKSEIEYRIIKFNVALKNH